MIKKSEGKARDGPEEEVVLPEERQKQLIY